MALHNRFDPNAFKEYFEKERKQEMKIETKREKEIYQSGFFAGKNSVTPKPNYTQEELKGIEDALNQHCDGMIAALTEIIEKKYNIPKWFMKVPGLKKYAEEELNTAKLCTIARSFTSYIQTKTIHEYIDHINTRKENK